MEKLPDKLVKEHLEAIHSQLFAGKITVDAYAETAATITIQKMKEFAEWMLKHKASSFGILIEWSIDNDDETRYTTDQLIQKFLNPEQETI